jgi:hypothetical protein
VSLRAVQVGLLMIAVARDAQQRSPVDAPMSGVDRAVILGGARTPIGRYGGALSRIRTEDLLGLALTGACARAGVPAADVEESPPAL